MFGRLAYAKWSTAWALIIKGAPELYCYTYPICCFNYHEHMFTILHGVINKVIKSLIY